MKSLTASDRKSLIRLASSLPKGDEQRRAILAGLSTLPRSGVTKVASKQLFNMLLKFYEEAHKEIEKSGPWVAEDGDDLLDLTPPRESANHDLENLLFLFSDVKAENAIVNDTTEATGVAGGFEAVPVEVPTELLVQISGDFLRDFSFGNWENSSLSYEFRFGPNKSTKSREGKLLEKRWRKKHEEFVARFFASTDFRVLLGKRLQRDHDIPDMGWELGEAVESLNGFPEAGYVDYDGQPSVRFLDLDISGRSFKGEAELTYDPKKMNFDGGDFGMDHRDEDDEDYRDEDYDPEDDLRRDFYQSQRNYYRYASKVKPGRYFQSVLWKMYGLEPEDIDAEEQVPAHILKSMKKKEIEEELERIGEKYGLTRRASSPKTAEDWIEKAVERPGRLHKYFNIPEGEKIPVSKIDGEIEKLRSKEDRTEEETSLLHALNLAKTLRKMGSMKKAGLDPYQARAVFMQFDYPEEYWHPTQLPDDKDVDTDEAEDILRSEGLEMFQRGMGYDEVDEDGEEIDEDDIDVDEVYGELIDDSRLERIYDDIERESKDLPKPPRGTKWEEGAFDGHILYDEDDEEVGFVIRSDRGGWDVHIRSPYSDRMEEVSRNVKRLRDAAEEILEALEQL